jgi:Short chain fatty acid transporter
LEVPQLDHHLAIRPERRRPLGGPGPVRGAGGDRAPCIAGGCGDGVAMGEQVANMLQPFWALPVVAIAGIGLQRVLGYTLVSFVIGITVYGLALLLLVPV